MSLRLQAEAAERYPVNTVAGRDYKAWAKRFIYRLESGDKTLMAVQILFAKQAMGIALEQPS